MPVGSVWSRGGIKNPRAAGIEAQRATDGRERPALLGAAFGQNHQVAGVGTEEVPTRGDAP